MPGLLSDLLFNPNLLGQAQNFARPTTGLLGSQPSPLDTAQWPSGPMGAPETAMAQQPAAPQAAPDVPETSLFGRLAKGLGDNSNKLLAIGAGMSGAPSFGTGVSRAAAGLMTANQADIKQQQLNATISALTKRGLSPEMAQAAAGNPAIMQQLLSQLFGAKQLQHVTIKDSLGNEIPMAFDPASGKYNRADIGGAGVGANAATIPVNIDPATGRDEKFLNSLNPMEKSAVEGILRGDVNAQGRNMQKFLPYAARAEPGFSQQTYQTRLDTAKDFTSKGKSGQNIKSLETVGGHLEKMTKLFPDLNNTWSPTYNKIRNWLAVQGGKGAVSAFDTAATGVANELGTVFRSYGMSDSEVKSWRDNISNAASPEQFKASMSTLLDMLKTRRDAIAEQYKSGLRQDLPPDRFQKLDHAIAEVEKMVSSGQPTQAAPNAAPASGGWSVRKVQ